MAWKGDRRGELPADWHQRRGRCRKNAAKGQTYARCQAILPNSGRRCPREGTDAHHPDRNNDDRLVWLCDYHHKKETQKQAQAARKPPLKRQPIRPVLPSERLGNHPKETKE